MTPLSANHRSFLWVLALSLLFGFAFQGSRGIWDADEGRYVNVALQMVDSGDWSLPRRHPDTLHLTKPPATYWAIAASASLFGTSELALRLPNTLAYVLSILLCFGIGRRLVPERPWLPALIYATLPLPFLAANWVTTDTLLATTEALALFCCVEALFGGHSTSTARRWALAMWAAFGLAFMVKGPPALLPLLGLLAWRLGRRRRDSDSPRIFSVSGVVLFLLVGGSWYVWAMLKVPGLFDYFVGHEVADRIASAKMQRFPEWWGAFYVYGLTLLLGTLPWLLWSGLRRGGWLRHRPRVSAWREQWSALPPERRLLWLWLLLPLLVFFIARSRLPLYVLPLFAPMAVLLAVAFRDHPFRRSSLVGIGIWSLLLLSLKFATGFYHHSKDGRELAAQILPTLGEWPAELVFIDDYTRYSLAPYCHCRIEKVSLDPLPQPQPVSGGTFDDDFASEMQQDEGPRAFIMRKSRAPHFEKIAAQHGYRVQHLGGYRDRVIYRLDPDSDNNSE
ncbi:MAG TPA: glycosyltransferase family 39 protein [Xanthomonadaceae bacterium]|nr:glycosyltransferase family 39 protein [Xanthomonadaceae bacterium]